MPIEIGPGAMSAFEARARAQDVRHFADCWNAHAAILGGSVTEHEAANLLEAARREGREIGLTDDEEDRLFLQAAAMRLMPKPGPEQFLLTADAIFSPASHEERFFAIVSIAQNPC